MAPNYVCWLKDSKDTLNNSTRVRLRWRDIERVERHVEQSFMGFLDAYSVVVQATNGVTLHLTALSKNLDDVCEEMRVCWLACSERPSLFGVPLRHAWPKTADGQFGGELPLMVALGARIAAAAANEEGLFRTSPSALELVRTR